MCVCIYDKGVFPAFCKWDRYLGSTGFLALKNLLLPRKTEVAVVVLVLYRVLYKRTSCKYFLKLSL